MPTMPRREIPIGPIPNQKLSWQGRVVSVQPRIRLLRSFDESSHTYLGYVLTLDGTVSGEPRIFAVAIGPGAQAKHEFRVGNDVSGVAVPVADPQMETASLYKASGLAIRARHSAPDGHPPWLGLAPPLPIYRERGHRRLDADRYAQHCTACIWGCRMVVEIMKDNWKGEITSVRHETFCYGPKSCSLYKAGPKRRVTGRNNAVWIEEDWVGEDATAHRGPDD